MKRFFAATISLLVGGTISGLAQEKINFISQIQPIFKETCIDCHGPDKQKGDLRLDQRDAAMAVISPGKPEESELYKRISLPADDIDIMPSKGDPLSAEKIKLIREWIAQGAEWPDAPAETIDFAGQIWPILEQRCLECHGPDKSKGDLRMDQKDSLMHVIVPGKAAESELIKRISLPSDDVDIMPAKGDPLSKEQIDLITAWINQGAPWTEPGAGESDEEVIVFARDIRPILEKLSKEEVATLRQWVQGGGEWPPATAKPINLQEQPPSEAEDEAIAQLQDQGVLVMRVAQDLNFLRANFKFLGPQVSNEMLAPLAKMPNLVEVELANTAVTDEGLAHLKGLINLTRLHLNNTQITDQGLEHLADLPNLVYLNLYGTQVTDEGLRHLQGLETLQKLYVWQTEVTDEGVQWLSAELPGLDIVQGWSLASVETEEEEKEEEKKEE